MPSLKILFLCRILFFLNQRRTFCFHCSLRCFVVHTGTIICQHSFRCAQIPIYPKALHESKVLRSHWASLFLRLQQQAVWTQSLPRAQWNEIFNLIAIFIPRHQRGTTGLHTVRYYSSIFYIFYHVQLTPQLCFNLLTFKFGVFVLQMCTVALFDW